MELEKLLYKRVFRGKVKKNGKLYDKYEKVARFPLLKNKAIFYLVPIVLSLTVLVIILLFRVFHPLSKAAPPEQGESAISYQE